MFIEDPIMLLSYVNTKLRDQYVSLGELCEDCDYSEAEIISKLEAVNYHYDKEKNQFV